MSKKKVKKNVALTPGGQSPAPASFDSEDKHMDLLMTDDAKVGEMIKSYLTLRHLLNDLGIYL